MTPTRRKAHAVVDEGVDSSGTRWAFIRVPFGELAGTLPSDTIPAASALVDLDPDRRVIGIRVTFDDDDV